MIAHTHEFRDATGSPRGEQALLAGAKALALAGHRLLVDQTLFAQVKSDFERAVEKEAVL